jgi:hypothetical protein
MPPSGSWPAQRVRLVEAHQRHKIDDNTVDTALLAAYIRAVGLECNKQAFVAALTELDPKCTGRIAYGPVVQWFKRQCMAQDDNDRRFNPLLVRPSVGHSVQPTHNLPGGSHVYGKPLQRDPVNARDTIFASYGFDDDGGGDGGGGGGGGGPVSVRIGRRGDGSATDASSRSNFSVASNVRREKELDAVAMNKRAVPLGMSTAREFQAPDRRVYVTIVFARLACR